MSSLNESLSEAGLIKNHFPLIASTDAGPTALLVNNPTLLHSVLHAFKVHVARTATYAIDCEATAVDRGGHKQSQTAVVLSIYCSELPLAVFVVHLTAIFRSSPLDLPEALSRSPVGVELANWFADAHTRQTPFVSFAGETQDVRFLSAVGIEAPFRGADVQKIVRTAVAQGRLPVGTPQSLAGCVNLFLGVTMDKSLTRSNWGGLSLTRDQLAYAASDVAFTFQLWAGFKDGTLLPPPVAPLKLFFYPNLMWHLRVVVDGHRMIAATCDEGAGPPYDRRHFVDAAFLASLPGGNTDMLTLHNSGFPAPIVGKGFEGVRAIGVLQRSFKVVIGGSEESFEVDLAGVLVVEGLPVPLHVSTVKLRCGLPRGTWHSMQPLTPTAFPQRYHGHPYWSTSSNFVMLGPMV